MTPTKRAIVKNGKPAWEVDFGTDPITQKRVRLYFQKDDEKSADKAVKDAVTKEKSYGEYWLRLSTGERAVLVSTLQEIERAKLTLSEVWGSYQAQKKEIGAQATTTPKAYEDVVEEFRTIKKTAGKSTRYVKNTCQFLLKFGKGRLKQNIHEITTEELDAWLNQQTEENEWSIKTQETYRLLFSSLWSLAIKRKWCKTNIVEDLEELVVPGQVVKIYENDQVMQILAGVMYDEDTKRILAPISLGFFGCMRPEEVESKRAKTEGLARIFHSR